MPKSWRFPGGGGMPEKKLPGRHCKMTDFMGEYKAKDVSTRGGKDGNPQQGMIDEGKAKKVFATENPEQYIVEYKADAAAFNGQKKGTIAGKGAVNSRMSNLLMQMLGKKGVPTHFVQELDNRDTLVRKVSIVPLEVIARSIAAGSWATWRARIKR